MASRRSLGQSRSASQVETVGQVAARKAAGGKGGLQGRAARTALGRTNRHAISTGAIPTAAPAAVSALPARGLFGGMFDGAPAAADLGQAAWAPAEPMPVPAGFAPAQARVFPPSRTFTGAPAVPDRAVSPEAPAPVSVLAGHNGWVIQEVIDFEDVQEYYGEDLDFPECAVHPGAPEECGVRSIRDCLCDGHVEAHGPQGGLLGRCCEMCTVWEDVEEES